MPNSKQKYTRWRNEDDIEDGQQDDSRVDEPLDRSAEDDDDADDDEPMQEGRRVLGMMTNNSSHHDDVKLSRVASARLVCCMILFTLLVFGIGVLVGFAAGNHGSNKSLTPPSSSILPQPCPELPSSTTNTTTTSTTTSSTRVPEIPEETDSITSISARLLTHLTPELIKEYARNISKTYVPSLRDFIVSSLKNQGFRVQNRMFSIVSSVADRYNNPNVVEVLKNTNGSQIINNATDSLKVFFPYSGFSPNASVTGSLIYVHYGTEDDYKVLENLKINVTGNIFLTRLGQIHPSVKIRNAEKMGAKGVILYPDPFDFGGGSATNTSYPNGMGLPSDGVVWQNLRAIPGDPSTPNYASQRDIFRIPPTNYSGIPSIPVQPVSSDTGRFLLHILDGPRIPSTWLGSFVPGQDLNIGGSFKGDVQAVKLTTTNIIEERNQDVIIAYPPAKDHSKVVHIGCHYELRDSYLTSTGISLASLLALGTALKKAYPNGTERLVVFTVFENSHLDSSVGTEYSQHLSSWLESSALAYIDLNSVLRGAGYVDANVSPILRATVREAMHHVPWAGNHSLSVYQGVLLAQPYRYDPITNKTDEDFQESFKFYNPYECDEIINYVSLHGIPSVHLSAVSLNKNNMYHLINSQYDTMTALEREDKDYLWTHMIVSSLGVTALTLASYSLPPVRFDEVGSDLSNAWKKLLKEQRNVLNKAQPSLEDLTDDITTAFETFVLNCDSYGTWYKDGDDIDVDSLPYQRFRNIETRLSKFMFFGRRFLRPRNVKGHTDFGSLLTYGPSPDDPCRGEYFPGVRKTLRDVRDGRMDWDEVREEMSVLLSVLDDFKTDS